MGQETTRKQPRVPGGRPVQLRVRLTAEEAQPLMTEARDLGVTVSKLVRDRLAGAHCAA